MPISLLRIARISDGPSGTRSRPCHRICPATMRAGGIATSLRTESAVTVLPQPDSPTTPSVSPAAIARSTPSTARTMPSSVEKCTLRPRISSSGAKSHHPARVERIAQPVADEVDRQHGEKDRAAGKQRPVRGDGEVVLGVVKNTAPGRDVGRKAEAEKRQRRFGDDRGGDIDGAGDDDRT